MPNTLRTGVLRATVFCFTTLVLAAPAVAGDVADVVSNLYGGDGITLFPVGTPPFNHDPHFTADSSAALSGLSGAIASGAGVVALNSATTSFTFDVAQGVPVRTTESLGPLLTERASTLGAGKVNVGMAFSRAEFKKFEGDDLNSLQLDFPHLDVGPPGVTFPFETDFIQVDIDLELEQNFLAFFGTYGITDNWDVGAVVPLVYVKAKAEATATVLLQDGSVGSTACGAVPCHVFDPTVDTPNDKVEEDAFGLGDIILRTKYDASDLIGSSQSDWMPDLGVLGQVSLETGDEDDLLGQGETTFLGLIILSKQYDWFGPHVNGGYEVATGNTDELNNLRYAAGFDARILPELTGVVDVIGRWHPDGSGVRDLVDLGIGAKWDPFDRVPIHANVLIPLNKNTGLRADVIWSVGFDITF